MTSWCLCMSMHLHLCITSILPRSSIQLAATCTHTHTYHKQCCSWFLPLDTHHSRPSTSGNLVRVSDSPLIGAHRNTLLMSQMMSLKWWVMISVMTPSQHQKWTPLTAKDSHGFLEERYPLSRDRFRDIRRYCDNTITPLSQLLAHPVAIA